MPASTAAGAELALVGATVYADPGAAPLPDATVRVVDGRIAEVGPSRQVKPGPGAKTLHVNGKFVVAGFWNSHVHLIPEQLLRAAERPAAELTAEMRRLFTAWGFTTVFDVASPLTNTLALRARIEAGEVAGPRVLTVGDPFYPVGGTPVYIRDWVRRNGITSGEVATPDEAGARARRQLDAGAEGAKVFAGAIVGGPEGVRLMQREIVAAVAGEASRRGRPTFAHPTTPDGLRVAVDGGANVLAHVTATEGPWPAETVRWLVERRVALVPTLQLFEVELAKDGVPPPAREKILDAGRQQVRELHRAGGTILFGTDVGYAAVEDTRGEVRRMSEAGLDWRAILRSMTTAPAERFGFGERAGRVARGYDGDLVVLGADPAASADALADVHATIRRGEVVYARPPR